MIEEMYCTKCGHNEFSKKGKRRFASGRVQDYKCKSCGSRTVNPFKAADPDGIVEMKTQLPKVSRYIVTSAQNATPIHKPTFETLKNIAAHNGAELVVIPGRYKNPTSQWNENNSDYEWWDSSVLPYLARGRFDISERLCILGDVKVQWAAQNPTASLEAFGGDKSLVVGHARQELRPVATPQHKHPKHIYTTGCCTLKNYTDTKQGKIAEEFHSLGGLIIEVAEDRFHVRQLCATQSGEIYDLDKRYTPSSVEHCDRVLSITMGDTHWCKIDDQVYDATFNGMIPTLRPHYLIWHDILDQYARNHHHKDNWIVDYKKHISNHDDVGKEVDETLTALVNETLVYDDMLSVVVSSNHDQALGRWLKESDFRKDPKNARFYNEIASLVMDSIENRSTTSDPFILYAEKHYNHERVKYLRPDESFILCGVEHCMHGDKGPNGSRGTTRNLSKIGVKVSKGHSHAAEIIGGCFSAGKSTGKLEYESGPSSHSQSHIVQYRNGKRAIITIVNGEWRL